MFFYAAVTRNHIDYNAPQIGCPDGIRPTSTLTCMRKRIATCACSFWRSRCDNKITERKACCGSRFAFRFLKTEPQSWNHVVICFWYLKRSNQELEIRKALKVFLIFYFCFWSPKTKSEHAFDVVILFLCFQKWNGRCKFRFSFFMTETEKRIIHMYLD